jgi:hypothetical protein
LTDFVYYVTVALTVTERADQIHHDNAPVHSTALVQSSFFWGGGGGKALHHPGLSAPYRPGVALCDFRLFPKLKSPLKGRRFVNATVTQYTMSAASHCRLTSPFGRVTSRMRSKVSSDWLPSYIKVTRPVFELFKMDGYFTDSPRRYRFNKIGGACWK